MLVVCQRFNCKAEFQPKPKSIEDCRNNYKIAINIIRSNMPEFPKVYYELTEDIIKGEKSLFYGMVYSLIQSGLNNDLLDSR
jgi:hypothetical protein